MTLNAKQLDHWIDNANPGDRLEYYRGNLANDRKPQYPHGAKAVIEIADSALIYAELGAVHLFQQRIREDEYAYLAVRRAG